MQDTAGIFLISCNRNRFFSDMMDVSMLIQNAKEGCGLDEKELLRQHPEWTVEPAGEGGQEYILVVCGCTAACAGHAQLNAARRKFVINSREQFDAACEAIKKENEV